MNWVIDCSFAAALFLPDEASPKIGDFFAKLPKQDRLFVPSLWWHELVTVLVIAERKKRLPYHDVIRVLSLLERFDLETDHQSGINYAKSICELAYRHSLTSYDATYLELAIRKGARLASLDKTLLKSASECGIRVYGEQE